MYESFTTVERTMILQGFLSLMLMVPLYLMRFSGSIFHSSSPAHSSQLTAQSS